VKHIAFFLGDLQLGGAERVVSIIASHLTSDYAVTIFSYYDKEPLYFLDPQVRLVKIEKETGTKNYFRNLRWLRKSLRNVDLLISFMAVYNIYALVCTLGTGIPVIVADRNDPSRIPSGRGLRLIRNLVYRRAKMLVVQNEANGRYFRQHGLNCFSVIQNPIADEIIAARAKLKSTTKENLIVSSGRLVRAKDQATLIKAFTHFSIKHPDYHLVILGEGPLHRELDKLIDNLGLKEKVTLAGYQADVFSVYIRAKMFIFSSLFEGSSNALLEALCLGLPVITTHVAGTEEVIHQDVNGMFFDFHDDAALAACIEKILGNEPYWVYESKPVNEELFQSIKAPQIVDKWKELIEEKIL
jgi:GalNAc-alpha-(1->4)-GalNAc-alpha-(1->3)-diNAcBac-PP-undecaprenol alpha-1,4-N-acetyl-D-galactosaminyltransferase